MSWFDVNLMRERRSGGGAPVNPYPPGMNFVSAVLAKYTLTDILFTPDGDCMYASSGNGNLVKYGLTNPWEIELMTELSDWGVAVLNTNRGINFNGDGFKLFFAEASGQDTFYEKISLQAYNFIPPQYDTQNTLFDIGAAYTATIQGFSIAKGGTWAVFSSADGSKGKGWFYYETLTPYDFSTIESAGFLRNDLGWNPGRAEFSDDGMMFTAIDFQNGRIIQYDLVTPWVVTSWSDVRVCVVDSWPPYSFRFGENGQKIFLARNSSRAIREYTLNPAYIIPDGTI